MTDCTVRPEHFDEFERLNAVVVKLYGNKHELWRAQFNLLTFIEGHPTLVPFMAQAAREKLRARERKEPAHVG
jgi:hypothetical protein